ncbi:MAG: hypothetical protein CMB80_07690 [Flammeovirgaceae bacterium]|nr:hypothetical protein [Flammeovirgaceae bacterium]HCX20711.1 hypothetical protein [Cytophagales bacterium]|tara:strand:+ start:29404 stop:29739 length:336 start_codon:yes stop_codon:yes gene_type:complete
MKVVLAIFTLIGFVLLESPLPNAISEGWDSIQKEQETLKTQAYNILRHKCNGCHKKQNPFMVFSEKNMSKRSEKIYEQVFVKQRMPKGNEVKLTNEEYSLLKNWLLTEINK